ncbi:unnamed protein product [Larinioides sclopetarius]|uniref:Uncharacterized protein n=1 Tax=Larinioides sclopetarius TaxID=280406 RepID=A0AAV2B7Q7_9ARAC
MVCAPVHFKASNFVLDLDLMWQVCVYWEKCETCSLLSQGM